VCSPFAYNKKQTLGQHVCWPAGFATLLPNFLERLLHVLHAELHLLLSFFCFFQSCLQGTHTGRYSGCTLGHGLHEPPEYVHGMTQAYTYFHTYSHILTYGQVDATIAKSVQRVTGSVIGPVHAFLVMLRPAILFALLLLLRLYACRWMPP